MRNTDKLQKEGRLQLIDWINRDGRENFLVLLNSTIVVMIYCCCSVVAVLRNYHSRSVKENREFKITATATKQERR